MLPLIRRLIGNEKLASLRVWVKIAVAAAEQLSHDLPGNGVNKKSWVRDFLSGHGIVYDEAALDALIESEVWKLKTPVKTLSKQAGK